MRKIGWMMALACVMALPAVVGMVTIFATCASAQVTSKSCGNCGKPVSITAKAGDRCPHCGVRWGFENTMPAPSAPSASEVFAERMAGVWKQTDQMKLAHLALRDKDADIRLAAVGRLTDQALLRRMVAESKDASVRVIAVWKVDDPKVLADVSKNDKDEGVRQAAANRQAVKTQVVDLGGGVKMELILIAPGSFKMGSEELRWTPVHEVRIAEPFYIGKYEVTQEQWKKVMGSNPSTFVGTKLPVTDVTWDDCQKFVRKLNERIGGPKFFLPTEAQWEYACRAGSTTEYYWGDDEYVYHEYTWNFKNSGGHPHPVGEKIPNAWGLYDMAGNVCECCADLKDNPMAGGVDSEWRGGAWTFGNTEGFRSACRYGYTRKYSGDYCGFRCARTP